MCVCFPDHLPDTFAQTFACTFHAHTHACTCSRGVSNKMSWSLADEPIDESDPNEPRDMEERKKVRTKIFLGYTSNMISAGVRDTIRFLVQHKMVRACMCVCVCRCVCGWVHVYMYV